MSESVLLADAVVTELNEQTFSMPFTAERRLLPSFELKELTNLQVTVVPKAIESTNASRVARQSDYQVDVGVQKKLSGDIDVQLPPLMALVEEIADLLAKRKLTNRPEAVWVGCQNDPIYSPGHLAETRTFLSLLTITYRLMK